MNRFEVKRSQSITRIREAAIKLFAEKGYDKTTIRMIAAEAGMALGLLYNYYGSKEDLLKDIYRNWQEQQSLTLQPDGDGVKRNDVASYIRQTIGVVKANRATWKLVYGIRMQSPVILQLEDQTKNRQQQIQNQIALYLNNAGISFPSLEARLLFASLDGLIQHFLQQENYPIDDLGNLLIMKYR